MGVLYRECVENIVHMQEGKVWHVVQGMARAAGYEMKVQVV